jgi:hypothetical protein
LSEKNLSGFIKIKRLHSEECFLTPGVKRLDILDKILAGFYAALSLHELEAENVPILIEYQVRYPSEF